MKVLTNLMGGAPPLVLLSSRLAELLGTAEGTGEPEEEPTGRSAKYKSPVACAESSGIDSKQTGIHRRAMFKTHIVTASEGGTWSHVDVPCDPMSCALNGTFER